MTDVDLYARISLDANDDGGSVDNQLKALRQYAADKGWTVRDEYRDDSISATTGKERPQFEAVLARAVNRPILTWNTDRFWRVPKDLERILEAKIVVYSIQSGDIDLSTVGGELLGRILTAFSASEGRLKSERMKVRFKANAEEGKPFWRFPPFGHNVDGSLNEPQAALVREAAAQILDRYSLYSIAKRWNVEGVPVPRDAKSWTASSLLSIFRQPRLCGHLYFKGVRQEKSLIEPIISEADFNLIKTLLDPDKRRVGSDGSVSTLGSGIYLCGICGDGTTVWGATSEKTSKKRGKVVTPIYRCSANQHCAHPRGELDAYVAGSLLAYLTVGQVHSGVGDDSEKRSLAADISGLTAELDDWYSQAREIRAERLKQIVKPIEMELASLETQLNEIHAKDVFHEFVGPTGLSKYEDLPRAKAVWDALPLERRREILDGAVEVTLLPRTNRDRGFVSERVQVVRK